MTVWAPPPLLREGSPEAPPREKRKPPVPPRPSASLPPKSDVDFVKRNSELSSLTPRKVATVGAGVPKGSAPMGSPSTSERSKRHGRVPPYLLDRKLDLAQKAAAAAAATEPRACPEGTHFLPEEERLRVLDLIADGQRKVHEELDAMPFVVDTFGLRTKHETLTQQLAQLNAAETAFKRSKVIVADESKVPADSPPVQAAGSTELEALPTVVVPPPPEEPLEISDL